MNKNISTAAALMGAAKSAAKTAAARANGALGGRPPHRWFILHRTGGVWSSMEGDLAAAKAACAASNAYDEGGTTEIQAGFATREECYAEFERLND